jgi:hypothetical protein
MAGMRAGRKKDNNSAGHIERSVGLLYGDLPYPFLRTYVLFDLIANMLIKLQSEVK